MKDVYSLANTVDRPLSANTNFTRFADSNGILRKKAAFKVGRRWYFNLTRLMDWAEQQGGVPLNQDTSAGE